MRLSVAVVAVLACGDSSSTKQSEGSAPAPVVAARPDAAAAVDAPSPPAGPKGKPGQDFIAEISTLYRVVACGHLDQAVPAKLQNIVDRHCKALAPRMEKYRADYFDKARAGFVER